MPTSAGIRAGRAFVEIGAVDKTQRVLQSVARRFRQFGQHITNMGQRLVQVSLTGLIPTAGSLAAYKRFDDAMKRVEARSTGTAEALGMVRDQAKQLGRETSFTASQVGELQAKLAQKGFTRQEVLQQTPSVLSFARAAGMGESTDAELAADIVASTLRQFGMQATETAHVSDVLTAAINNSSLTMETLGDGMKYVGPVAKIMNASLEDTVAIIGQLANAGLVGSLAGTGFRRMFLNLSDAKKRLELETMVKELTGVNLKVTDAEGNLRRLSTVLFELGDATKDLGTADRLGIFAKVFGRGVTAAVSLSSRGANPFNDLLEILRASQGEALKTARIMDSGVGGAWRLFLSAVEAVNIAIGESLDRLLKKWGANLRSIFRIISLLVDAHQDFVRNIFLGILAIGGMGIALLALGTSLKLVAFAISGISVALGVLFSPIRLMLSLGASLIGVLSTVVSGVSALVGFIITGAGALGGVIASILAFAGSFTLLGSPLLGVLAGLSGLIVVTTMVITLLRPLIGIVKKLSIAVGEWAATAFANFIQLLKRTGIAIKEFAIDRFAGLASTVKMTMAAINEILAQGGTEQALKAMSLGLGQVWIETIDIFKDAWAGLQIFLIETWEATVASIAAGIRKVQKSIAGTLLLAAGEGDPFTQWLLNGTGRDVNVNDVRSEARRLWRENNKIRQNRGQKPLPFIDPVTGAIENIGHDVENATHPWTEGAKEAASALVEGAQGVKDINDWVNRNADNKPREKSQRQKDLEAGIAERKKDREARREFLHDQLEYLKWRANEGNKTTPEQDWIEQWQQRLKDIFDPVGGGASPTEQIHALATEAPPALVKGSIEAAQAAYANEQTKLMSEMAANTAAMLKEQERTNQLLQDDNEEVVD